MPSIELQPSGQKESDEAHRIANEIILIQQLVIAQVFVAVLALRRRVDVSRGGVGRTHRRLQSALTTTHLLRASAPPMRAAFPRMHTSYSPRDSTDRQDANSPLERRTSPDCQGHSR